MVLEIASLQGLRLALAFFALLAALLGAGVAVALRRRAASRAGQRGALAAGLVLGCGVLAAVYHTSLSGFGRIEIEGDRLRLARALPGGEELPLARLVAAERAPGTRPWLARLVLRLDDGRALASASAAPETIEPARRELAARLAARAAADGPP